MGIVRISFEDIKFATDNFNDECLGRRARGKVYKGQLPRTDGQKTIAAKRWDKEYSQRDCEFNQELEILSKFKHMNVIGLEGYCDEMGEKIIVYEYASNKSLDRWLNSPSLTWKKRLEIGIDIANGLEFLHGGVLRRMGVLHGNIKSSNILLSGDWKAKITAFWLSLVRPNSSEYDDDFEEHVSDIDPAYMETDIISKSADIYSFGVVLFEILCGRLACPSGAINKQYLGPLAKNYYEKNKLDELVFEGIKEQIVHESLSTFANIAYNCLEDDWIRPTASEVQKELQKALELQEDWEMWESKLPSDYKEILQQSENPEISNAKMKEVIYNMLSKGMFIQKGKVWFWLDGNSNKNKMLSATLFTYQNQSSQRWRRIRKSRFQKVAVMADISNLNIQIHVNTQFLTPGVEYGVFLVFKFGESKKTSSKPKYVSLKYKKENESFHAYFASWRDDNWMMIELYRFFNNEDACNFEILLESFSRYYCRSGDVYVEGIELRALDNVLKHEPINKLKDAQEMMIPRLLSDVIELPSSDDDDDDGYYNDDKEDEELAKLSEMNGKKRLMLSARKVLYGSSIAKPFKVNFSEHSRFGEVIEVLSQQVIYIKCMFSGKHLSRDINYRCYLIFKLSEKCRGLHCPVKLRDLVHRSNKGTKSLYLRPPNAWNIHDINHVPKEREDGWMEVNFWTFKKETVLDHGYIVMTSKLICYEGTMFGLIVCGLEFRPEV